jgi:hypothetical protein
MPFLHRCGRLIPGAVDLDSPFPSWPGDSPGHLPPHVVEGCPLLACADNWDGTSNSTAAGIRSRHASDCHCPQLSLPPVVIARSAHSVYCWRWLYWDAGASATGSCGLSRKQALNTIQFGSNGSRPALDKTGPVSWASLGLILGISPPSLNPSLTLRTPFSVMTLEIPCK